MKTLPSASTAKPSIVMKLMRTRTNIIKNPAKQIKRLLRNCVANLSSSILLIIYKAPRHTARNITISPNSTLNGLVTASSPCQLFAQRLITGAPKSATAFLFTINSEPVKKVPTAVPINKGARQPLMVRKVRKAFLPRRLPALF